ncbi:MAG: HAD family phosphatase [Prevotella sp.]|nr:HAD family phosphatase [Prevotella sp.]
MSYQLMLIDCDRTLLNDSGIVTERTKTAISNAVRNGVKTVFASGRAPGGIENMVKAIGEEHLFEYFVCFNGGLIIRAHDKQVVSESSLTIDDVIHIVDSICCKPEDYYVLTSGRLICQGYNKQAEIEAIKNNISVTQGAVWQLTSDEKIFKLVFAGEVDELDLIEKRIPVILRKQFHVTRSEPNNLEFVSLLASKGNALVQLADLLHIRIKDTICFGDAENDSSMIMVAGTGVAMGNASEELKAISDIVTDSNNNEGLAKAIEKLVLSDYN